MLHYKDEFETDALKITRHCIGALGVNTYCLICKKTHEAAVIDPGGETGAILESLSSSGAHVTHMLFTHCHVDHIYGAESLKAALPEAKITYHALERIVVENIRGMCEMFRVPVCTMPAQEIDLSQTPELLIGALQVRSILTPGHTPGGVCYYLAENDICFTGDTLFRGSVGRTDFEGGNGLDLRKSLDLLTEIIPDTTKLLPGHGKFSVMGDEKKSNFYLRIDRFR